jgi:hypothetical protein
MFGCGDVDADVDGLGSRGGKEKGGGCSSAVQCSASFEREVMA